jgi:ATP-dependent helicase/nuclease subunit A
MVGLIREGHASVDDLAAITFTRKAASEMKERLYKELLSARAVLRGKKGSYVGSEGEEERVDRALAKVEQCFVGTVHAFCGRILREHALEAGLPPDFTVGLDDAEEESFRSRVWQEHVTRLYQNGTPILDDLEELGLRPSDLTGLFEAASSYPELDLYTNPPATPPDLDDAVRTVKSFVETWQSRRPDPPINDRGGAQKALDRAENVLSNRSLDTPAQKARLLQIVEEGYKNSKEQGNVTLKAWGARGTDIRDQARDLRDEIYPDLVENTLRPVLRDWKAHVHEKAIELVRPATKQYLTARRTEGQLTHHDVLYHTKNLLRDNPDVRRRVHNRFPRLLVDEFQDTDPLQAEILFLLTAEDRTEEDWRACTPRPGSLFIVGDDKQSIYRFRRADIDVFEEVVSHMKRAGGEEAPLTRNFRSYAPICNLADRAFGEAFNDPKLENAQAEYIEFDPERDTYRDEHCIRRLKVGYHKGNPGQDIAEDAAGQIAGFIREALDEKENHPLAGPPAENPVFDDAASPEDFLILTGKKKHLSIYGEALARAGVPFSITGSDDLGESDDLKAFTDLLTCALRPGDELAAVSYLRGALCGMSDDDLYRIRRAFESRPEHPFRFTRDPVPAGDLDSLDSAVADRLEKAGQQVRKAREILESKRPALALPRIAEKTGILPAAAHAPDGESGSIRAGRLLRAFALVQKRAGDGEDWAQILDHLQEVLDGDADEDGLTLESGSENAVRIMNLHQAKGLEAPVVFLADPYPETGSSHSPVKHVRHREGDVVVPITKETPGGPSVSHPPLGWNRDGGFEETEERHEAAEKKRLAYVAATRAERLLVVSEYHHENQGRKAGDWADLYPYVDDIPVLDQMSSPSTRGRSVAPDLSSYRERRRAAIAQASRSTHRSAQISRERERDPETPAPSLSTGRGYGRILGIAVHTLLEEVVREGKTADQVSKEDVQAHFGAALEEKATTTLSGERDEVPSTSAVNTALSMVERYLASDLARRVKSADRVFVEYPVTGIEEQEVATAHRGVIDLLYKDADGWHIVDYKTDRVGKIGLADAVRGHEYADQVRRYAQAFEAVAQEPVASTSLWFADVGTIVET